MAYFISLLAAGYSVGVGTTGTKRGFVKGVTGVLKPNRLWNKEVYELSFDTANDVVILSFGAAGGEQFEAYTQIQLSAPNLPPLILTWNGSVYTATSAEWVAYVDTLTGGKFAVKATAIDPPKPAAPGAFDPAIVLLTQGAGGTASSYEVGTDSTTGVTVNEGPASGVNFTGSTYEARDINGALTGYIIEAQQGVDSQVGVSLSTDIVADAAYTIADYDFQLRGSWFGGSARSNNNAGTNRMRRLMTGFRPFQKVRATYHYNSAGTSATGLRPTVGDHGFQAERVEIPAMGPTVPAVDGNAGQDNPGAVSDVSFWGRAEFYADAEGKLEIAWQPDGTSTAGTNMIILEPAVAAEDLPDPRPAGNRINLTFYGSTPYTGPDVINGTWNTATHSAIASPVALLDGNGNASGVTVQSTGVAFSGTNTDAGGFGRDFGRGNNGYADEDYVGLSRPMRYGYTKGMMIGPLSDAAHQLTFAGLPANTAVTVTIGGYVSETFADRWTDFTVNGVTQTFEMNEGQNGPMQEPIQFAGTTDGSGNLVIDIIRNTGGEFGQAQVGIIMLDW